jgi:hypothetical protein
LTISCIFATIVAIKDVCRGKFMNAISKQELITRNYNHIYAHEMAHKMAGGSFAGNIVIERNSDGIPVAGHVPIKMPVLDKRDPQSTIDHANVVIRAALAPGDPSSQDFRVAAQAEQIKMQALAFKAKHQGNKLDTQA